MSDPGWEGPDHALTTRAAATQATLDAWKGKSYCLGTADCARMVASHLRRMGYKISIPATGSYRTEQSAKSKMEKMGLSSASQKLDDMGLPQIAPAAALVGDIIELPSDESDLSALAVYLGNGRILGWHPDVDGAVVMQPIQMITAWRVEPI